MSTLTAENILTLIEELPLTERIRLNQLLARRQTLQDAELAMARPPLDKRVPCEPMKDRAREMAWIEEHKHEYAGQWVALDGDRLIAASPIQQKVWDAVKAYSADLPLVHRIPSPDDLPFIGI
ncbi:MAG TPA: DUF5678 domain-containing protein [Blastocatellia bacterium]|nr:DUF5678 domain-containing protein [Blastocatellia bacterium]